MEPVMEFKPFCDYFASWMPPGITDKDYVIAQYDGAIAYMDACIQTLFNALETRGVMDETIIVINGDHGETLYDHECWFDHHGTLRCYLACTADYPLPGTRACGGNGSQATTSTKTLVPTLLELADIETDIEFDGKSLTSLISGRGHFLRQRVLYHRMYMDAQARLADPRMETHRRA